MSQTQDSIGIKDSHKAQGITKSDGHAYNGDLSGTRKSTRPATYPWTADVALGKNAAKVRNVKPPID
jgi:hypothetical protein